MSRAHRECSALSRSPARESGWSLRQRDAVSGSRNIASAGASGNAVALVFLADSLRGSLSFREKGGESKKRTNVCYFFVVLLLQVVVVPRGGEVGR